MKKQLLVTVIAMIPAMSFAKVSDFNAMIAENIKEQNQLHSTVTENVGEARQASNTHERIVIVENNPSTSYNAPTKKDLLAFKKEKKNFEPSQKKQLDRLATEINLSDE
ncbi:MAG TPA: hypothetical protein VF412_08770 [Bdellovibrio sp.]|uniref:hypothetical protein n=1 Tax=Bdellovibrio sp. TaxID=28201 RepID=UPI002F102EC1